MNKSISNKIGATIASVLFVTITIMLFVLLAKEESQKMDTTRNNVVELSELMTKSISFAMAEGTTEVAPLIDEASKSENISELRIIPTDLIEEGSSNNLDELEKEVWGEEMPDSDSLRVHIHSLRSAIDKPFGSKMIQTRHGIGYRLVESNAVQT